ncbi:spore germination protein [Bacillus fonticola]|uniref:spore germination protein n=1 Tax=Bacillus fonticola TaxID=2728853 RepID=UPI001472F944|nr:spore germination protein [Bacillus fonticola]
MPAIVGPVVINNQVGGEIQFGDTFYVSPKSATKLLNGSGGGNTGGIVITNNGISVNNTFDVNGVDQPITGNA